MQSLSEALTGSLEDQVLSWHNINGENAQEILPAILITNRSPFTSEKEVFQ